MISTRLLRPLAVVAFAAALVTGSPANATDLAKVIGTGTISPGLPDSGCTANQEVTFDGTLVLVGQHAGVYGNLHFEGSSSICESVTAGAGCGTVTASGPAGTISGTVCYNRTGNVVTLTGSLVVNGVAHVIVAGSCQFAPTTTNPVQSYALTCQIVIQS